MSLRLEKFSEQQTDATKHIIRNLDESRSVVLIAQMQSGKSDTYYFVAFEFIRTNRIDHVVIVMGFTDKELVEQTKDYSSSFELYDEYMDETLGMLRVDRNAFKELAKSSITFMQGSELTNPIHDEFNATLFIWDESHYASNKINRPFKFMKAIGVPVDGNENLLSKRGNFVLTVSATPYAEISDVVHEHQRKVVVMMKPGNGYIGVKQYYETGNIIGVKDWKTELPALLLQQNASHIPTYSIVRVYGNNSDAAIKIATASGIDYEVYDMESRAVTKKSRDATKMQSLSDLRKAPTANKCVIIKGMMRMGKRLEKKHLSFVMETSTKSNTDVILQGLLGRVCGYHTNIGIRIYVSENMLKVSGDSFTKMNEIDRYIKMMDDESDIITTMPLRATNVMGGTVVSSEWVMSIPIIITQLQPKTREEKDDPDADEHKTDKLRKFICAQLTQGVNVTNNNTGDTTDELVKQLKSLATIVHHRKMNKNKDTVNATYTGMPQLLHDSITSRVPITKHNAGCWFKTNDEDVIIVWEINSDMYSDMGFTRGSLIVCGRTKSASGQYIPKTTGREAFTIRQEDDAVVEGNGAYSIQAPIDTWRSVECMQKYLENMMTLSLMGFEGNEMPRCVTSNQVEGTGWKGILVNSSVLEALEKKGSIYNYIFTKYGEKLQIKKQRGKKSRESVGAGQVRLAKIEW